MPILLSTDLRPRGRNPDSLALAHRRSGSRILRLRKGAYVDAAAFHALSPMEAHLVRLCAFRLRGDLEDGAVLARESAAVVHRIPFIGDVPDLVQLVRRRRHGGRRTATTRTLTAPDDCAVSEIDGVPVTTVAQTLVDLGRRRSFRSNLVSIDNCLHRGVVTKEELLTILGRHPTTPGNGRLRHCIEYADARCESPGESLSRAVMIEHHLPMPELQKKIVDRSGDVIGRVDFIWPDLRVIGEFDGAVKYTRGLTGRSAEETVVEERRREQALERTTGMRVVRWVWDDALREAGLLRILADVGVRPLY